MGCWDAKYAYWHIRPSQYDPTIKTLFTVPNHPAYPSGHAIYDGSYAEVLSYLFPRDEAFFRAQAQEAALSRIWAGIHYRSDIDASLVLSREVGKRVIAWAIRDGSKQAPGDSIFVDISANPGGNGSPNARYQTISDAINQARE